MTNRYDAKINQYLTPIWLTTISQLIDDVHTVAIQQKNTPLFQIIQFRDLRGVVDKIPGLLVIKRYPLLVR